MHHSYAIEANPKEGVALATEWVEEQLGIRARGNPDVSLLSYGLLSVEDARKVAEKVSGAPFAGTHTVVIIAAERLYHEAQNALLKVFEEPPPGTHLFLILPSLGGLLPTLRSRVEVLRRGSGSRSSGQELSKTAIEFLKANKEERSAIIKRLTSGKDDEARRENREEALLLMNGLEHLLVEDGIEKHQETLTEIAAFRSYLYDRSAPVKLILEHLALVV